MEVIPALDLLDGKAVRLRQGRYDEVTVYDEHPNVLAAEWSGRVRRVHVVDLDGAKQGKPVQRVLVRKVVASFGAGVQVGRRSVLRSRRRAGRARYGGHPRSRHGA
jgi:phosphoribosylformimino-5-aminoimidazole carboxamide ribotide isomerase